MGLVLKYVQAPNKDRDTFRYRRRVPAELHPILGKKELIASLGSSRSEALASYPRIHTQFEQELEVARKTLQKTGRLPPKSELSERERYELLIERLREMGIENPLAPAQSEEEWEARDIIAENIATKYPEDPDSGRPVISDKHDAALIRALKIGLPQKPSPSFDDAVKLYKADKIKGSEREIKKNTQRLDRIVSRFKAGLGYSPQVDQLTRADARKVRDYFLSLKSLQPASVKRELNVIKAIINHAITEFDLTCTNPFKKLEIEGLNEEAESDRRDPFPQEILHKVREHVLANTNPELCLIWRLLEGTGARLGEITGLRRHDVTLEGPTPNIRVTWHEDRRLKTLASRRFIPLVGDALDAAREALELTTSGSMLFPRYGGENGPTNASQLLNNRVRNVTDNPRLVVHSLRHNMKDRLVLASIPELDQNLILGHSLGSTGNRVYGGDVAKLMATTRAMRRAFNLPEDENQAAAE